ncbi:hypothetical protein, partial [Corynebacterium sp. HMSC034A01]|uniref:hypothetical protein n=1 Tax=Corynebacterium sp. HMSC034A01 TaxID=1739295 RepID=UPI001FEF8CFC
MTKRYRLVDLVNQLLNSRVEFVKVDALVAIECVDDLVGDDLDCGFDIRFVFRPFRPRGQCCGVVMLQKLLVGRVSGSLCVR